VHGDGLQERNRMADPTDNDLLNGLNENELAVLRPHLAEVPLEVGTVVAEAGQPPESVYFPTSGVLSLVGATASGATVEVAIVGREGIASVSAVLGPNRLPFRIVTQVSGSAWRMPTDVLARQTRECGELTERILRYSESVILQIGQSAICNRFHNAKQRLARWLLMTVDRAGTRQLPLSHEFISYMVGGPRSAVTEAAAALRASGAIDYRRGLVHVRDMERLQQESCECYSVVQGVLQLRRTG
jgi:CRP-like cAMP-binding protein